MEAERKISSKSKDDIIEGFKEVGPLVLRSRIRERWTYFLLFLDIVHEDWKVVLPFSCPCENFHVWKDTQISYRNGLKTFIDESSTQKAPIWRSALVPGLTAVVRAPSTSCLATEENWNSGRDGASLHICSLFAKLWRWPVWHQGCRAAHDGVPAWPLAATGLLGEADVQTNAYGMRRAAVGTAPLCYCGSAEGEGTCAGKFYLQIPFSPSWPWGGWQLWGDNLVHFMGKQELFWNTWLSWIFFTSYRILGGIKSWESTSGMTVVSLWPVACSEYC